MDSGQEYEYDEYSDDGEGYTYHDEESDHCVSPKIGSGGALSKPELKREPSTFTVPYDEYIIKSAADVVQLMRALTNEMSSLLGTSFDESLILLGHFKWDKEKLTNEYFLEPERLRTDCGLPAEVTPNGSSRNDFECHICYETFPSHETSCLACNHHFCNGCYREYLRVQISEGPQCILACCPEYKCRFRVLRSLFEKLVLAEELAKLDEYFLRNYTDTSKCMRHCPAPRCDKVAVGSGITSIDCSCGMSYCFKCGDDAHEPCSCAHMLEWKGKCANESETANWILANTRKCPACNTRIEKNQGCNHMTCRICKHEFCWICMGVWSEHGQNTGGFYKCNRFSAMENAASVTEAQRAKAELDRYLHYYQRFHGHDQALQFALKQVTVIEKRLSVHADTKGSSYVDNEFIKRAAEQVVSCRRVLKYTYVLGYYLKERTPEKQLFEYQQEMLEKHTEHLQEFTEKPVESLDASAVVNLTRVTDNFMKSLLATMTGGVVRIEEMQVTPDKTGRT